MASIRPASSTAPCSSRSPARTPTSFHAATATAAPTRLTAWMATFRSDAVRRTDRCRELVEVDRCVVGRKDLHRSSRQTAPGARRELDGAGDRDPDRVVGPCHRGSERVDRRRPLAGRQVGHPRDAARRRGPASSPPDRAERAGSGAASSSSRPKTRPVGTSSPSRSTPGWRISCSRVAATARRFRIHNCPGAVLEADRHLARAGHERVERIGVERTRPRRRGSRRRAPTRRPTVERRPQ